MKNIFKLLTLMLTFAVFVGCEEDLIIYSNTDFAQLEDASAVSIVENSGGSVEVVVQLGGPRSTDTNIEWNVGGDPAAGRYTLTPAGGSLVIPAGDTEGSVIFTPVDNDDIDGDVTVELSLSESSNIPVGLGGEAVASVSKSITIVDDNVPCNDVLVRVTTDEWGTESSWQIYDADVTLVASGGPYNNVAGEVNDTVVTLEDGCYTFIMYDSYGDGMASGSYSVTCGSIVHASGSGALDGLPGESGFPFGPNFAEATDFCVNQ